MRWIDGFVGAMRPISRARRPRVLALDDLTADRLLSRSLPPADAPPEFHHVAVALRDLAQPPTNRERAGQASSVDQITAIIRSGATPPSTRRRSQTSWKI